MPLSMTICYLFNIIVFEFETSNRYGGTIVRGSPLLAVVGILAFILGKTLVATVRLVIFTPLIVAAYSLFLIAQKLLRTFTDGIMLVIIGKLGRTPSRDTAIARKISGPGMSRNYYYSINE